MPGVRLSVEAQRWGEKENHGVGRRHGQGRPLSELRTEGSRRAEKSDKSVSKLNQLVSGRH